MTEFFLKLLGVKVDTATQIAGASVAFHGGGIAPGWLVLAALFLAALTWWSYRLVPESLTPVRKAALMTLRGLFLGLLLVLLLRPVLAFTVEGSIRRSLLILVDGSSSMQIRDPRVNVDDLKRAALVRGALNATNGLTQILPAGRTKEFDQSMRLDLVKAAFRNEQLDLLPRLDEQFDLVPFSFGQRVTELPREKAGQAPVKEGEPEAAPQKRLKARPQDFLWVDKLDAQSPGTALGDAMREVLQRKRGQPLAGVVLATDGANNLGSHPRDVAAQLREAGVPLFIYGIGITAPRDIIVANIFAPEISFARDEVEVKVRVRSQGLAGESAKVQLKLGETLVAEAPVNFAGDGEQLVTLRFTPDKVGEFDLTASIEARDDETVKDNNSRTHHIRVIDAKIKVLLVEQSPRWEFRYLQAMLMRDRRIELKTLLMEGDPALARGEDSPYLEAFPARKEDLFKYDVILFGDVDPKGLTNQQFENLNEFVSRFGGAFVMVAGRRFAPHAYRNTVLERLLPVEFDSTLSASAGVDGIFDKPIRLELTGRGKESSMLRLSDKDDENLALWRKLPPVYWVAKVTRAKPAAEVLLVDPDPVKETRFGKMPVVAQQQYGLGQVLYIGTDNTWRWRKNVGDQYYTALWGQVSQRMAIQRLMGASKRTQLSADRQNFVTGERVGIYARLYSVGFEPVQEPVMKGVYVQRGTEQTAEVQLKPVPEQPGLYRGEFIAPSAGFYKFHVEQDPETKLDFNVTEPKYELGETAMNEPLLRDLAASTGGAFLREEDLHRLPALVGQKIERLRSSLEVELWSSPLYFLLILLVVSAEWILRKVSYLK